MPDLALADRLREAREYLGLGLEQAAAAAGCSPLLIEALEAGTADPFPDFLGKVARVYMRPIGWFYGEGTFQPDPGLLLKVEHLTPGDREAILDFAEFLHGAGQAPRVNPDQPEAGNA